MPLIDSFAPDKAVNESIRSNRLAILPGWRTLG